MPNKLETALELLNTMAASNRICTAAEWNTLRSAVANEYHATKAVNVAKPSVPTPVVAAPAPAVLIKTAPAGIDFIDVNGAAMFTTGLNLEDKIVYPNGHYAPRRYISVAFKPYLDQKSHAWNCIDKNMAEQQMLKDKGGLTGGVAQNVVQQPDGSWRFVTPYAALPNTFCILPEFTTIAECVAHINALIASNTNPQGGGNFSPVKP